VDHPAAHFRGVIKKHLRSVCVYVDIVVVLIMVDQSAVKQLSDCFEK